MGSERYRTWLVHWIKRIDSLDPYGQQAVAYRARRKGSEGPPSPLRMLLEFGIVLGAAVVLIAVVTLVGP
jgi:hypothetical protein